MLYGLYLTANKHDHLILVEENLDTIKEKATKFKKDIEEGNLFKKYIFVEFTLSFSKIPISENIDFYHRKIPIETGIKLPRKNTVLVRTKMNHLSRKIYNLIKDHPDYSRFKWEDREGSRVFMTDLETGKTYNSTLIE